MLYFLSHSARNIEVSHDLFLILISYHKNQDFSHELSFFLKSVTSETSNAAVSLFCYCVNFVLCVHVDDIHPEHHVKIPRTYNPVMVTMLYLSQRDAKTLLHRYTSTWKKHPRLSCMTLHADFWNTWRTGRLGSSKKPSFTMIIFMVLPINVRNRSVVTSCSVFRKSIHRFANSSTLLLRRLKDLPN